MRPVTLPWNISLTLLLDGKCPFVTLKILQRHLLSKGECFVWQVHHESSLQFCFFICGVDVLCRNSHQGSLLPVPILLFWFDATEVNLTKRRTPLFWFIHGSSTLNSYKLRPQIPLPFLMQIKPHVTFVTVALMVPHPPMQSVSDAPMDQSPTFRKQRRSSYNETNGILTKLASITSFLQTDNLL